MDPTPSVQPAQLSTAEEVNSNVHAQQILNMAFERMQSHTLFYPRDGTALDVLWVDLRQVNTDIEVIQKDIMTLERMKIQLYEEDIEMLRTHKIILEARRNKLRFEVNRHPDTQPTRHLTLTCRQMPTEIVRLIAETIRPPTVGFTTASGDVEAIQRLRLTCKDLNNASSHVLITSPVVRMTQESVARLTEMSQHPTISKGIRVVNIDVGRHFNGGLANDFHSFARLQLARLDYSVSGEHGWVHWDRTRSIWQDDMNCDAEIITRSSDQTGTTEEEYRNAIIRARDIFHVWDHVRCVEPLSACNSFSPAPQPCEKRKGPHYELLRSSWNHYRRLYDSQEALRREAFAKPIASAMKQMPTASWLRIVDEYTPGDQAPSYVARSMVNFLPKDMEDPAALKTKLEQPTPSWHFEAPWAGYSEPPVDTIPTILSSMGANGICLKGLEIYARLPLDISALAETKVDYSKLRAASDRLTTFRFNRKSRWGEGKWASTMSLNHSNILHGFLSTLLDTSTLKNIHLDFDWYFRNGSHGSTAIVSPAASMATILLSRTWEHLEELSFNGPFRFEDLKKIVNRMGKKVSIRWSGYLMDGSWAAVLDLLRGRVLSDAFIGHAGRLGSIAGAEIGDMKREDFTFIFREDMQPQDQDVVSRATQFIRGMTDTNPMVKWAEGTLMEADDEPSENATQDDAAPVA